MEVVGASWRTAATMITGIMYAVGYFVLATAAMYVREWQKLALILSLTSVVLLVPVLYVFLILFQNNYAQVFCVSMLH